MFAKLRGIFKTATRAMSSSSVVPTAHALAWAVYADGSAGDEELVSAQKFVERSEKLASVRSAFVKEFDKVLDSWAESPRQSRIQAIRELEKFEKEGTQEEKEDLLIAMIDLFESDKSFDDAEKEVAKQAATILGLGDFTKYL